MWREGRVALTCPRGGDVDGAEVHQRLARRHHARRQVSGLMVNGGDHVDDQGQSPKSGKLPLQLGWQGRGRIPGGLASTMIAPGAEPRTNPER